MNAKTLPLPHGVSESNLLDCAVLWEQGNKLDAVRLWRNLTNLPINLAKTSLERYLEQLFSEKNKSNDVQLLDPGQMTEQLKEARRIMELLPLDAFKENAEGADAADFVDNARHFIAAMDAAREFLKQID